MAIDEGTLGCFWRHWSLEQIRRHVAGFWEMLEPGGTLLLMWHHNVDCTSSGWLCAYWDFRAHAHRLADWDNTAPGGFLSAMLFRLFEPEGGEVLDRTRGWPAGAPVPTAPEFRLNRVPSMTYTRWRRRPVALPP